jgi:hypothetical protein
MVLLTQANDTIGTGAWKAGPDKGRFSRTGSIGSGAGGNGSGTALEAITDGAIAGTEASLTEERERRLAEEHFQSCE